jgi:uncharacterized protein YegJ (DUF2314 family)
MRRSLCLLLGVAACKGGATEGTSDVQPATRTRPAVEQPTRAGQPVPAGSPLAESATIQFAIYFLPRANGDARAELVAALRAIRPALEVDGNSQAASHALVREPPIADYPPPERALLEFAGRGLRPADVAAVQDSQQVVTVDLVAERARIFQLDRQLMEAVLAVASKTGGLLWDEDARQLYSVDAWRERLARWKGPLPEAPALFSIHSYQDGELFRVVTLGLGKLGLPDLVVEQVARSEATSMAGLINLVAQTMVDGAVVRQGGLIDVDSASVPDKAGGPTHAARATLTLVLGKRDEGDADNRLWEIAFPGGPASELQERHEALLAALFGVRDEITVIDHDEEMQATSRRARARLVSDVKKKFSTRWTELNHLMVKAPFRTDEGANEWMWLDVTGWKGKTIEGILQNEPTAVPGLRAGAHVSVDEQSIFDYIVKHADGTTEGGLTVELEERRHKKR